MSARLYLEPFPGTTRAQVQAAGSPAARASFDGPSTELRTGAFEPTAAPGPGLTLAHSRHDRRGEEIRALRTELLLRRDFQAQTDVVALLSPRPGEGRTQLAAELAIAFSQLGRRTLLVDADLRNPRQHILFGADNGMGLSQALRLGGTPQVHTVAGLPQLHLVTAGPIPPDPLELLLHGQFATLIEEWRQSFEFVVLDTAAVTPFSDALAVASVAGRVLALTRANRTPYQDTREMLRRLEPTRAQILGAVISRF